MVVSLLTGKIVSGKVFEHLINVKKAALNCASGVDENCNVADIFLSH